MAYLEQFKRVLMFWPKDWGPALSAAPVGYIYATVLLGELGLPIPKVHEKHCRSLNDFYVRELA